ncbi:uncharacterized protein A4U43_C03F6500 [Asparagus officinalis]|uniref:Replication factor A C-terminal domain-containing protein n=1 Tax=Asparagus officinalis TaxID=4686 RepID=A0A5P1FC86_ASPOF|nr:uncharacterized protein A4U43_C03F6500 [Asparagus officinalis]
MDDGQQSSSQGSWHSQQRDLTIRQIKRKIRNQYQYNNYETQNNIFGSKKRQHDRIIDDKEVNGNYKKAKIQQYKSRRIIPSFINATEEATIKQQTNIIGYVKYIYPLEQTVISGKPGTRRALKLIDEENIECTVTLWNQIATNLESALIEQDPNNMVMVVSGIFVTNFRGNNSVSSSTATKIYVNIPEQRVVELSQRYMESETQMQLIKTPINYKSKQKLLETPSASLNDLILFNDPETAEEYFFICNVRINTIMDNQKWRYRGCPDCFKKTIDAEATFWCAKCDREVFAENSYRITMEVQDESAKTTFVVMNKEAEKLVKIPAQEVA